MTAPITYTIRGACEASGLPRTALYQELKAGRLRAFKRGKRTLVSHESLAALIAALPAYKAGA